MADYQENDFLPNYETVRFRTVGDTKADGFHPVGRRSTHPVCALLDDPLSAARKEGEEKDFPSFRFAEERDDKRSYVGVS